MTIMPLADTQNTDQNLSILDIMIGVYSSQYYSLAAITLLLYDYIITLPLEIRYIWNDHFNIVSALYLLNRYTTLLGYIPYMFFQFDSPMNETICQRFTWFPAILVCLTQVFSIVVFVRRSHAMYHEHKWVPVVLAVGGISIIATSLWTISLPHSINVQYRSQDSLVSCVNVGANWYIGYYTTSSLALAFDLLVVLLTMYMMRHQRGVNQEAGLSTQLQNLLMLDGLVYFSTLTVANVVSITVYHKLRLQGSPTFAQMNTKNNNSITHSVFVIMISRLTLNLRNHLEVTKLVDNEDLTEAETSWWGLDSCDRPVNDDTISGGLEMVPVHLSPVGSHEDSDEG